MAITDGMDEREQRDFDLRLNADISRPSQGVEQLWGMMGTPKVAPGAGPPRRPPARAGSRKIGEAP